MNDPQTWTVVWGLTVGVGVAWAQEGKEGKIVTKKRITIKKSICL